MPEKKLLIATHDSATGEKPANLLSRLISPFAKTQNKTILQQYQAGCTMFDIRVRKVGNCWKCAHGLWTSDEYAESILWILNRIGQVYVFVTYEGQLKTEEQKNEFKEWFNNCKEMFPDIYWGSACAKYGDKRKGVKVDWIKVVEAEKSYDNVQGFLPLDGRSWHTYLPIPWLWNKIYTRKHKFNTEYYVYVDFL